MALAKTFSILLRGQFLEQRGVADFALQEGLVIAGRLLGIEREGVLAFGLEGRIEAVQVPVAALDGILLLLLGNGHAALDAMVDARRIGDDDRRSVIGFSFGDGLEGLGLVGAHGDLGDIDIAVAHGHHAEVLLLDRLAAGGKLGDSAGRGRLGGLAAGVGIDLGVEDQDVDVFAGSEDVVQSAVTDVIGPAVAADDPG